MRRLARTLAYAAFALGMTAAYADETLTPPEETAEFTLMPANSSLGSTEILISVLAVLLVWAAVEQNERAKSE